MKKILLCLLIVLVACTQETSSPPDTRVILSTASLLTRAGDPDDNRITDYNLYIFNAFGILEERVYVPARALTLVNGKVQYRTTLLRDVPYTILAAANLGYELPFRTLEEAREYRYHLAYPDEFSQGIPMVACQEGVTVGDDGVLEVELERLMARIELTIDRSQLQSDIQFKVTDVRVGACPSSVKLMGPSKVSGPQETFSVGYGKTGNQVSALNEGANAGLSRSLNVYLLENCQGDLLENVQTDSGKVFRDGRYQDICSYIELKAEYHSPTWNTAAGERLVYRFYLGENLNNFDVVRNTWYRITVCPRGDGLGEDSWRVNKEALKGS
jgi:hypothetical protein